MCNREHQQNQGSALWKNNKVDKPLVRLTKEKRERRLKVLTQGCRKDITLNVVEKKN